jgi:hypothetical protein
VLGIAVLFTAAIPIVGEVVVAADLAVNVVLLYDDLGRGDYLTAAGDAIGVAGDAGVLVGSALRAQRALAPTEQAERTAGVRTTNVLENQRAGNAFRDSVATQLQEQGFNIIGTELRVNTSLGTRVVDILAERNGFVVAFETKLGSSRYLPTQFAKDQWIERFGGTFRNGARANFPTVLVRG